MCSNNSFFKKLFWIGTKLLILSGIVSFLADVGTDVSFSVQLFSNCHYKTGIALLFIIFGAVISSLVVSFHQGMSCLETTGYLLKYTVRKEKVYIYVKVHLQYILLQTKIQLCTI